jgi:predicted Rossmann fold nucleotide-binding protein DprA/Smf involved in DNA uptake
MDEGTTMHIIHKVEKSYSARLADRVGVGVFRQLTALGNLGLLNLPKTALFCSAKSPGSAILTAYDQAAHWRDAGRCIISGFHSPIEKECLRILLRGTQPIVICPARSLENMRLPGPWKAPLAADRLLILSAFGPTHRRVTADLGARRNELVAALSEEAWFAHITPGGQAERLTRLLAKWQIPFSVPG